MAINTIYSKMIKFFRIESEHTLDVLLLHNVLSFHKLFIGILCKFIHKQTDLSLFMKLKGQS